MQDEDVLSDAHKCLEYAFNHRHNCPQELREKLNCNYYQKLEEEKAMKKTAEERQQEISDELVDKLTNGEEIKGIDDREHEILRLFYIEGKTYEVIADEVGLSKGYCGNLKKDALDKIKHNEDKNILVECSFNNCSREKKFIKGKEPNKWTCWQHEDEQKSADEDQGDIFEKVEEAKVKTQELAEAMTKEEHEEAHNSSDMVARGEEIIGVDYADQEKEDTEHILVMIQDGQAKVLSSEDQQAIDLAADSMKDREDIDKLVAGKEIS